MRWPTAPSPTTRPRFTPNRVRTPTPTSMSTKTSPPACIPTSASWQGCEHRNSHTVFRGDECHDHFRRRRDGTGDFAGVQHPTVGQFAAQPQPERGGPRPGLAPRPAPPVNPHPHRSRRGSGSRSSAGRSCSGARSRSGAGSRSGARAAANSRSSRRLRPRSLRRSFPRIFGRRRSGPWGGDHGGGGWGHGDDDGGGWGHGGGGWGHGGGGWGHGGRRRPRPRPRVSLGNSAVNR